jgi:hypothetical protein
MFPADERRSDMLFIIARSLDAWSAGGSAYAPVRALIYGDTGATMPYFPGTWLAHGPAHALGLDLRLGGAVVTLVLGVVVVALLRSQRSEILAVLVFANPYHLHRHDLYFDHFLAMTVALFAWAACPGGRAWPWIAALTGVAVATRQWAWIYGPFVLLAAVVGAGGTVGRIKADYGPILARLSAAGAVTAAAGAVVCLPGILPDPARFSSVLYLMSAAHGELCLGFASAAIAAGLVPLLRPVQIIICAGTFAHAFMAAVRGRTEPARVLATGWICLIAVVAFSSFQENYFWLTPSFAALGLALGVDCAAARADASAVSNAS